MKYLVQILFFSCILSAYPQARPKPDALKEMGRSDTLVFSSHNSGCFNSGTNTYIIVKLKSGERHITYGKAGALLSKKITAKKFDAFIASFRSSMKRFKDQDEKPRCTLVSDFVLKDKKQELAFKNGSCEAQFNPEETLLQILK